MKSIITTLTLFILISLYSIKTIAQPLSKNKPLTHADTLRGVYGAGRDWWDVLKYDLHVKFNIPDKTIKGHSNNKLFCIVSTCMVIPDRFNSLAM